MSFSAADIISQDFPHYKLSAPWDKIIGKPAENASILLFSGPGSGKSTVALQLCDEMTRHGKTAFMVAEEGISSTFAEKLERLNLTNTAIQFHDPEGLDNIKEYVIDNKIKVLCIDSYTIYDKRLKTFDEFRQWCKKRDVMFVSIVQTTKDGKFYGNADAAFNVDCVLKVTDGKPSTMETGKNRLGELYEHDVDLREKPVAPVKESERKNPEAKSSNGNNLERINPNDPNYYGIDFIEPEFQEDLRENRAPTPDDLYQTITDQILALIESGKELPWQRPWNMKRNFPHSLPTNFVSKNAYRGINKLLLMFTRVVKDDEGNKVRVLGGFEHPYYLTVNQIDKLGGKMKNGAVGQPAFYFNRLYAYDQASPKLDYSTTDKGKFINWAKKNWSKINHSDQGYKNAKEFAEQNIYPLLRYYNLFNGSDIEGIDFGELEKPEKLSESERIKAGELIVENYPNPPEIEFTGSQPRYLPKQDKVEMTPFGDFKNPQGYYSVFFHELSHSTGHSSRLDRGNDTRNRDGSDEDKKAYKFEELVAEMSAAFISAEAGILFHTREMSAAYLKGYKQALAEYMEEDDRFFFRATSRAQAATDYILDRDANGVPAYLSDFDSETNKSNKTKSDSTQNYFVYGKKKGDKQFGALDYSSGNKVGNLIYASTFKENQLDDLKKELDEIVTEQSGVKLQIRSSNGSIIYKAKEKKKASKPSKKQTKSNHDLPYNVATESEIDKALKGRKVIRLRTVEDAKKAFLKHTDFKKEYQVSDSDLLQMVKAQNNIQFKTAAGVRNAIQDIVMSSDSRIFIYPESELASKIIKTTFPKIDELRFDKMVFGNYNYPAYTNGHVLITDEKIAKELLDREIKRYKKQLIKDGSTPKAADKKVKELIEFEKPQAIDRVIPSKYKFVGEATLWGYTYALDHNGDTTFLLQAVVTDPDGKEYRFDPEYLKFMDRQLPKGTRLMLISNNMAASYVKDNETTGLIMPIMANHRFINFEDAEKEAMRVNPDELGQLSFDGKTTKKTPQNSFRTNGKTGNLIHLGFVEQLDWNSDRTNQKGVKGNFFLFSNSDGDKLYIVPQSRVAQMKGSLDDAKAEKLFEEWSHYAADHKDLEITLPSEKPQKFATAKKILYASDKIMQHGDKKGKVNYYKHDFDNGKRPVSKMGDVLIIDKIKWDERGILN